MTGKDAGYYENMIRDLLDEDGKYAALKANSDSEATEQFYYSKIAHQVLADVKL